MKITYTLTWEEYAEQFQATWSRPDYFSAIVVCIVAIPLLGYGIALKVFGMPDETTISETFIGAPLLLLVTTIVSVVTQTREARKRITAEKRLAYERAYAAEQSFSFDQDHWICETEAGNQEIPWTALQVAANGKVFFI